VTRPEAESAGDTAKIRRAPEHLIFLLRGKGLRFQKKPHQKREREARRTARSMDLGSTRQKRLEMNYAFEGKNFSLQI
jgi:hypothetical protein